MLSENDLIYFGAMMLYSNNPMQLDECAELAKRMYDTVFNDVDGNKESMILE